MGAGYPGLKDTVSPEKYWLSRENCTNIPGRRGPDRVPDRESILNYHRVVFAEFGQAVMQPVILPGPKALTAGGGRRLTSRPTRNN
jgi:hypothetical protein